MSALQTPPRLAPDTLRIIPLGGLGDIGRNMTVFEINGKLLVVDCGVLFPEDDQPGVDLILPGLDYLDDRLDDIVGLVLTIPSVRDDLAYKMRNHQPRANRDADLTAIDLNPSEWRITDERKRR